MEKINLIIRVISFLVRLRKNNKKEVKEDQYWKIIKNQKQLRAFDIDFFNKFIKRNNSEGWFSKEAGIKIEYGQIRKFISLRKKLGDVSWKTIAIAIPFIKPLNGNGRLYVEIKAHERIINWTILVIAAFLLCAGAAIPVLLLPSKINFSLWLITMSLGVSVSTCGALLIFVIKDFLCATIIEEKLKRIAISSNQKRVRF